MPLSEAVSVAIPVEPHVIKLPNFFFGSPRSRAQETEQSIGNPLVELLAGRVRSVEYSGGQVIVDAPRRGRVYLPGSFNPLHEGHRCARGLGSRRHRKGVTARNPHPKA